MSDGSVNRLELDADGVIKGIRQYLIDTLNEVGEKLLDEFSREIMDNSVGKIAWRQEAITKLRKVEEKIVDNYIEMSFGLPAEDLDKEEHDRISVALFGNKALDDAIYTKPGFDVYDDVMSGRHISTAVSAHYLPDGFSMEPNTNGLKMLENAVQKTQKTFKDALDKAAADIPDAVFYGNLRVIGG